MTPGWLAGTAEIGITPPLGVEMTGYGNRPGPADDVLDPLFCRALALSDGAASAVLVSLDLLGLDPDLVEAVRHGVRDACGLEPAQLLLNCSHTHAGPATQTLRGMGRRDPAYCELVWRWTVTAVVLALRRMQPARLSFGRAPAAIGRNRRERRPEGRTVIGDNPEGAYDPTVYALQVETIAGEPLALWFSHATHPVILSWDNTAMTAEFPGEATRILTRALKECDPLDDPVCLFAQGCCGDVNPVRRGDRDAILMTGWELADAVAEAMLRSRALEPGLGAALETTRLPLQLPASETEARAELQLFQDRLREVEAEVARGDAPASRLVTARGMVEWGEDYVAAARDQAPSDAPFTIQALRLGDCAIVGTSGETFIAIGQSIQTASPFPDTVVLGYTNGCLGYIPTKAAFPEGGYEVSGAHRYYGTLMVTDECEQLVTEGALRVLAAVR